MGAVADNHQLTESINHYISAHGYQLLHVGSETSRDNSGNPWHSTVAVLGKQAMRPITLDMSTAATVNRSRQ